MSLAGSWATLPAIYIAVSYGWDMAGAVDGVTQRTIAAANSGKTSMLFKCAPRARARWFQVAAGSLDFPVSRFVRGLMGKGC